MLPRLGAIAVLVLFGAAGCGGSGSSAERAGDPLNALAANSRPAQLIFGTSDYGPGRLRISFLLARPDGSLILQPKARLWIAPNGRAEPSVSAVARLETVTVPGARVSALGTKNLYVARADVEKPGTYTLLVEPIGGRRFAAMAPLHVQKHTSALAVGSRAPDSATPTVASAHGNVRAITTRVPADRELLRYSVKDSLAAAKPFVLTFATPAFCANRTCGPIVDVVDAVRRGLASSGVRFIHVEPFADHNPGLGFDRWAKEWHIPSEPYTFLVGTDGRIKAEFEGSVSVQELTAAVQATLLHASAARS